MSAAFNSKDDTYVNTPRGLFTASGTWFRTTEELLREFAGPVLEHESLSTLLEETDRWLRSAQTVTLWMLPLLLLLTPPLSAVACALVLYVGWKSLSPSVVSRLLIRFFKLFDNVLAQGLYYVFMLSLLAARGQMLAAGIGVAGFVLLRWGLLAAAARPVVRPIQASLYPLPAPDQVLRTLVIRTARRHGLSLPALERLEEEIRRKWSRYTNRD